MNREQLLQEKLKVLNELLDKVAPTTYAPNATEKPRIPEKERKREKIKRVNRLRQTRKLTYKQQEQLKYDILINNFSAKKIERKYNINGLGAKHSIINNYRYIHVPAVNHNI